MTGAFWESTRTLMGKISGCLDVVTVSEKLGFDFIS